MSLEFSIRGVVYVRETHEPLPNLIVRAYDRDLLYDDLLGDTTTDKSGRFEIRYTESDFRELFEKRPDVYFRIYDKSRKRVIHTTADSVRWNAGKDEFFEIAIPRHKIPPDMLSEQNLLDGQGSFRTDFEVGESLLVNLRNLEPSRSYMIRLLDDDSEEIFNISLVSNRYGVIEPAVLWPDMGIGVPEEGGRYAFETFEEAMEVLAGRTFTVEVLANRTEVVQTIDFSFNKKLARTRLYPISKTGTLQRGFRLGEDAVRVRGQNFPLSSIVDIYLVERQYEWHLGDAIVPIRNLDGSEVAMRIQLDESDFEVVLWKSDLVRPGSYDVIARVVSEHEYRAKERLLRETDFVSEPLMTTLVVRRDLYDIKPIYLGCPNVQEIAGKKVIGSPYFEFSNYFVKGEDVWAALDPTGLVPQAVGRKVRFYVVQNGTITPGTTLSDLTGTISEVITSASCINVNKTRVWSNPQQTGSFDLVADFGNMATNPSGFIPDDKFDMPDDMVDGYTRIGFHILDDPSVTGTEYQVGMTSYSGTSVTIPAVGVWAPTSIEPDGIVGDTPTQTFSLPLTARIRYPADTSGTNVPVSSKKTKYPLVVVMHGMSGVSASHEGYDYLLDHLASHGFIAVSIDCYPINSQVDRGGFQDTRAHAMLEHLDYLKSLNTQAGLFSGKIDMTKIGIMGHSRGGDGVVQAEIYNQSLGKNFDIKAIVALAPTDFSGTNPTISQRLTLTTSKFLCIYGSNDADVWGGSNPSTRYTGTGFRFYDRATVEKAMVFIYGAVHNRFNTKWGTEGGVDTSSPKIVSVTDHKTLLRGYMTAFMKWHLDGDTLQREFFTGELKIPAVSAIEVHCQYQPPTLARRTLDDFETNPAITTSSINGQVTPSNLAAPAQENLLGTLDVHAPHQTRGVKLEWNSANATYESEIPLPGTLRNVTGYKFLSFRVSQTVLTVNPANQLQDFYVTLMDGTASAKKRAVRVGGFDAIPFPYKPEYTNPAYEDPNTKAALKTIRIPLHAWTIKAASADIVDLSNVKSIKFEFRVSGHLQGEILVDDIEFCN